MSECGIFTPGEYASLPKTLLADPNIGLAAKIIYLGLQTYLSGDKAQAWPGAADLGRKTGLVRRTIQNGIAELAKAGWISKQTSGGPVCGNGKRTNLYTLHTRRTHCTSAVNTPLLAQTMPIGSANNAPKEPNRRTQRKNPIANAAKQTPPDPRIRTFIAWFSQAYFEATGAKYVVQGGKDGQNVKRLLLAVGGDSGDAMAELQRAARAMLADKWGKSRADIGLLLSKINNWRQANAQPHLDDYNDPISRANGLALSQQATRKRSTFTPAATDGTDYNSLAQKF